jgi:hypothetical protein
MMKQGKARQELIAHGITALATALAFYALVSGEPSSPPARAFP